LEQEPNSTASPVVGTEQTPIVLARASAIKQDRFFWLEGTGVEIVRATRSWLLYGTVGFAVLCIVVGAVEALWGE